MKDITILPAGITESCRFACTFLQQAGFRLTDHVSPEITHLLLDTPSFDTNGNLHDGSSLEELLTRLPENITVVGGFLNNSYLSGYSKIDLLDTPLYLAKNAAITAECAIQVASAYLTTTIADTPALVLGWGRIGKCLSRLLQNMGCCVTVAARSKADRSMLVALGYQTLDFPEIPENLYRFRILFNTVPQQTVEVATLNQWSNILKVDLASAPGLTCDDVITARGLPGKYAPATTGKRIAETLISAIQEVHP